jgi:predicted dehydrogenase
MIGAGGIAENAQLPAYARIGLPVAGLYDVDTPKSRRLADRHGIERIYASLTEAIAQPGVIFDLTVPARAIAEVIAQLPDGSAVLIQKPMGETLGEARRILTLCRERRLIAAINFQLRFSPNMLALRDALDRGLLGEVTDVEVRINTHTPWALWDFLKGIPRLEVLYHSIHYLDLLRSLLGDPRGVHCRAVRHPELPHYADTGNAILLDYGAHANITVRTHHNHRFGSKYAVSELRVEGTRGAAVASMGVNLSYPKGEPDRLELRFGSDAEWRSVPLVGSWFIEAFEGTMSNLQRFVAGEDETLHTRVEDTIKTMALVEACYQSSEREATPIPTV